MNTFKRFTALAIFCIILSYLNLSHAATQKGDFEVSGQFYYSDPGEGDAGGQLYGSIGYFTTDHIEFKLASFIFLDKDDIAGSIGPGVDYFLNPQANSIFSIGASYQLDVSDDDNSEDQYEVHVGLKHFLTERVTLDAKIGYRDSDFGNEKYALLGIAYFF